MASIKHLRIFLIVVCGLLFSSSSLFAHGNLVDVVAKGQRGHALEMIVEGTDVNAVQSDGTSSLMYAVYQGDHELVAALLNAGAKVNHTNEYGAGVMGEAAMLGDAGILKLLLEHGGDATWANPEGESALMLVARAGNLEAASLLITYGADINARERWGGQTAAMWAASQHQPEMLQLLIDHGADINAHGYFRDWDHTMMNEPRPKDMNNGGFSPLLYAAREGCTACVAVLAAGGADLNATDPDRVSALNLALINLHFDTAAALIEAGADVNQWDLFGRAPLYNAIDLYTMPTGGRPDIPSTDKLNGYDIAAMLLERGANPNMQLKLRPPYRNAIFDRGADNVLANGATPLIRAARAADNESVRLLLKHGALVDLPNSRGHTPLLIVAGIDWPAAPTRGRYKTQADSIETIKILLEHGADINALTGDPASRPQSSAGNSERGAELRQSGGPIPVIDGQTALHAAAKVGWNEIIEFLVENGARQQVKDSAGNTPFDYAMGRYAAGFLSAPPEPMIETGRLLQTLCMQSDNCVMDDPVDFSNPSAVQ